MSDKQHFDKHDTLLRGIENLLRRCLRHGLLRTEAEVMIGEIEAALSTPSHVTPKYATPPFSEADRIAQQGPQVVSPPSTTPQKPGETPRTEAMIESCGDYEKAYHYNGRFAEFARQLERELAEANKLAATAAEYWSARPASVASATPRSGLDLLKEARKYLDIIGAPTMVQTKCDAEALAKRIDDFTGERT